MPETLKSNPEQDGGSGSGSQWDDLRDVPFRGGQEIKTTGGPDFDERLHDSEAQRMRDYYGQRLKPTGGPGFDERLRDTEAQVAMKREKDAKHYETVDDLVDKGLPENYDELKQVIGSFDVREDFVKNLLEKERGKLDQVCEQVNGDYSPEASQAFNSAMFEYLAVVNALKDMGAQHLKRDPNYYDAYHVDLNLSEYSSMAFRRGRNGCDVNIQIPKGYGSENPQVDASIVKIIQATDLSVNNQQNAGAVWSSIGYKAES